MTDNIKALPTAWATAKAIRARIFEETGLTASAGVSYNKLLAKLASDHRKPNGQFAIQPDEGEAFIAALPVAKLHGVGPVTAAKMHALGVETGADLREKASPSCRSVSARREVGISELRAAATIAWSSPTASGNRRDRRRPFSRI